MYTGERSHVLALSYNRFAWFPLSFFSCNYAIHRSIPFFPFRYYLSAVYVLRRKLLAEEGLERLAVLSEFLDALVQLVECHLVLEECPAELGLVVDKRDLVDFLGAIDS